MTQVADLVERRSELLAKVVLTRRLDIDVFEFDAGGEMGLDLLCSVRSETVPGFLTFGALVWGTADQLETPEDVAKQVRARKKKLAKRTRYFIPVIVLLFSMHKDEAYFSWLVEPREDTGQLVEVADLDFQPFDVKQLDRMTRRITNWYRRLATTVLTDAVGNGSANGANDE
jgi:hypothetical protein